MDDLFTQKRDVELAEDGTVVGHGNPHDNARARLNEQADAEREADPEFIYVGNEPEAQEQAAESDEITDEDRQVAEELRAAKQEQPEDAEALAIARKLQNSTEEEAAKYLAHLRKQPTEQDVDRVLDQRLQAQAMERFREQNRDVIGNPYLDGAAGAAFQRRRQAGDTRSDLDVMGSAVAEVRAWVNGLKQPSISPEKIERKATITKLPTASARVSFEKVEDDEDTGEVIQNMARARGQQYAK